MAKNRQYLRFLNQYYLFNYILVLVSVYLRLYFTKHGLGKYSGARTEAEFYNYEKQIYMVVIVLVGFKWYRQRSLDHFLYQAVLYVKMMALMMAFLVDIRLMILLSLVMIVHFALYPQPRYVAGDADEVFTLNPLTFKEFVVQQHNDVTWLVFCHSTWSCESTHMVPVWNELSRRYASDKLKFGSLDVSQWPHLASDLKISITITTNQLPSILCFEKGQEHTRWPPKAYAEDWSKRNYYTKKDIVQHFQLEKRKETPILGSKKKK